MIDCEELEVQASKLGIWPAASHAPVAALPAQARMLCMLTSRSWLPNVKSYCLQVETAILKRALHILHAVIEATTAGKVTKQASCEPVLTDSPGGGPPADSKPGKGGKDVKAAAKKGAPAAAAEAPPAATGPPDMPVTCTLEAWHVDVLAQSRLQAAEVHEALWQPAEALQQLHLAMAFLHSPGADSINGLADSPSDALAFAFSGARWLSLLEARCRLLLQLQDNTAAAAAAQELAQAASKLRCRRSRAAAHAGEAAAHAQRGAAADALQLYSQAQSTLAAIGDTGAGTAAVLLAHGDLRCALGLRAEAQQLWLLAADMLRADVHSRGLPQEQAAPELVNIYAAERTVHVRALLCAARSHNWSGNAAAAQDLTCEALRVLPLCRAGPDLVADAHLMHGRLLLWQKVQSQEGQGVSDSLNGSTLVMDEQESGGGGGVHDEVPEAVIALKHASEVSNCELGVGVGTLRDVLLHAAVVHAMPALLNPQCTTQLPESARAVVEGLVRAAGTAAAAQLSLRHTAGDVGAVDLTTLPQWFVSQVRGRDARHLEASQRTKAAADETEVQEAVWLCFRRLCEAPAAGAPVHAAARHALQHVDVHRALAASLPAYKEQSRLPSIPPMALEPTEGAEGGEGSGGEEAAVAAQWLRGGVPGCEARKDKEPAARRQQAPLQSGASVAQVLQVPRPEALCSLVFVLRRPGTAAAGSGAPEAGDDGVGDAGAGEAGEGAVRLVGVRTVADALRWSTLHEIRRARLALEARASGTQRLLIQPDSSKGQDDGGSGDEVRSKSGTAVVSVFSEGHSVRL